MAVVLAWHLRRRYPLSTGAGTQINPHAERSRAAQAGLSQGVERNRSDRRVAAAGSGPDKIRLGITGEKALTGDRKGQQHSHP